MGGAGETPTARIVGEARAPLTVVDADGRRLFKALGPGLSDNTRYVGYAMLAYCVSAIDGMPVPAPATEGQVEMLVTRLGDAGLEAVGEGMAAAVPGNG